MAKLWNILKINGIDIEEYLNGGEYYHNLETSLNYMYNITGNYETESFDLINHTFRGTYNLTSNTFTFENLDLELNNVSANSFIITNTSNTAFNLNIKGNLFSNNTISANFNDTTFISGGLTFTRNNQLWFSGNDFVNNQIIKQSCGHVNAFNVNSNTFSGFNGTINCNDMSNNSFNSVLYNFAESNKHININCINECNNNKFINIYTLNLNAINISNTSNSITTTLTYEYAEYSFSQIIITNVYSTYINMYGDNESCISYLCVNPDFIDSTYIINCTDSNSTLYFNGNTIQFKITSINNLYNDNNIVQFNLNAYYIFNNIQENITQFNLNAYYLNKNIFSYIDINNITCNVLTINTLMNIKHLNIKCDNIDICLFYDIDEFNINANAMIASNMFYEFGYGNIICIEDAINSNTFNKFSILNLNILNFAESNVFNNFTSINITCLNSFGSFTFDNGMNLNIKCKDFGSHTFNNITDLNINCTKYSQNVFNDVNNLNLTCYNSFYPDVIQNIYDLKLNIGCFINTQDINNDTISSINSWISNSNYTNDITQLEYGNLTRKIHIIQNCFNVDISANTIYDVVLIKNCVNCTYNNIINYQKSNNSTSYCSIIFYNVSNLVLKKGFSDSVNNSYIFDHLGASFESSLLPNWMKSTISI